MNNMENNLKYLLIQTIPNGFGAGKIHVLYTIPDSELFPYGLKLGEYVNYDRAVKGGQKIEEYFEKLFNSKEESNASNMIDTLLNSENPEERVKAAENLGVIYEHSGVQYKVTF
jgi:hypothetical protein